MRRAVSLILGLLLVLRALLGDAMAMGLAPMPPAGGMHAVAATAAVHATHGLADTDQAGADARLHGQAALADGAAPAQHCASAASAASDCHADHPASCSACGICHSALSVPAGAAGASVESAGAPSPQRSARFASAPAALAIKPPIS